MADLLQDLAVKDDLFSFVLDFVDGLPKVYNTVDVAISRIGELRPIEVSGYITGIPEPIPVQITKKDYEEGRAAFLLNKTHFYFHMAGEGSATPLICCVHNVLDLSDFPYGKMEDEFSRMIQKIQYSFKNGRRVQILGRYVTLVSSRKQQRVLYVDTLNIEDDALSSRMTDSQFERFIDLCKSKGIDPIDLFRNEVFAFFDADDYLKDTVAVFCLSPRSREEMSNILILSAPGEGKDYLIDKVIQPMVRCGKVGSDQVTTHAAMVGAMSTNDLSSLGIGVVSKYHNERLACSEVQTWSSAKFGSLIEMMSNGYVTVTKGKVQDMKRPATENILMAGNIPNNWKEGMNPWDKLEAILGGKNKHFSKQLISRFVLMFARVSLLKNPDPVKKSRLIFKNIDDNSSMADDDLFNNDDIIKGICLRTDMNNRDKSRMIRERKIELLCRVGKSDGEITARLKHSIWQHFFGQYFKYVSLTNVRVQPVGDVIYRSLMSMAKREGFERILCNESGDLDARKLQEYSNLCKSFAKVSGRKEIDSTDIRNAESLFKESVSTIATLGVDILVSGLEMIELDILKFVAENHPATVKSIREHIKVEGATCPFFQKNMDNLIKNHQYVTVVHDKKSGEDHFFPNYSTIPDGLMVDMNIQKVDISTKDSQAHSDEPIMDIDRASVSRELEGVEFD